MERVTVNGTTIAYTLHGEGEPLLLRPLPRRPRRARRRRRRPRPAITHYERALRVYRESGGANTPEAARATLRLRDLTAPLPDLMPSQPPAIP